VTGAAKKPLVAIVGRPNVGKSTLFNRLTGRRQALVHDTPGVTRDRKEGDGRLFGLEFRVVDTAGLERAAKGAIEARMLAQTGRALDAADLILFVVDARAGVTPADRHFAAELRKRGRPIVLVANKCEGGAGIPGLGEAHGLGFGEPVALSAEHNQGFDDLRQAMVERVPALEASPAPEPPPGPASNEAAAEEAAAENAAGPARPLALAIVGQPNAGKSTLVNRLLGEERVIVGPEPGLTRDAISVDWSWRGRAVRLVDTAGLRRKGKVSADLETLSALDALRAIDFADVVVLVVDAVTVQDFGRGLEKQDLQIARRVVEEGRGLVVAANKWDLVADPAKQRRLMRESLDESLAQAKGVPLAMISALDGTGLDRLMAEVLAVEARWNRRVPTARLNRWLAGALEANPPPIVKGRRVKIRYMTQAKARPPRFVLFTNRADAFPDFYERYLVNGLREAFDLAGVPIRVELRGGKNPYAEKD
jgi:GTPase